MNKSIDAYRDVARVTRYDREMDLRHPHRHSMAAIALEVLPYDPDQPLRAVDLGVGTGFFTSRFLQRFPLATVIGIDGSEAMLALARARLGEQADRVRFVERSFESLRSADLGKGLDVILSSYALHHLDAVAKGRVLALAGDVLRKGGWLLNADLVSNAHPDIDRRIQDIRARGIQRRNAGTDARFVDLDAIRAFLSGLDEGEGDQPLTVPEDLELLRRGGIANATVFWQEYREVVMGGFR